MDDLLFVKKDDRDTQGYTMTTKLPNLFSNEKSSDSRNNRIRAFQIFQDKSVRPALEGFVYVRKAKLLTERSGTFPSIVAVDAPYGIIQCRVTTPHFTASELNRLGRVRQNWKTIRIE